MIKLFTDLNTFPKSFLPPIVQYNSSFVYVDSVEECDYVLLPHWEVVYEYTDNQFGEHNVDPQNKKNIQLAVKELIAIGEAKGKPLIVVYLSDSDKDIPIENAIVFRTSLYKSGQKSSVFAYPSWGADFQADYLNNQPNIRSKNTKPHVGFRGSAVPLGYSMENFVRSKVNLANSVIGKMNFGFRLPYAWNEGQILRQKAIKKLISNTNIKSDFAVLTRGYISQKNATKKALNRKLFIDNMVHNDYVLCARGAGNYSYRLYETLSAGRIPLFINTDCVLPYDFFIDWKKYCVWVEESEIDRVDELLLDFHHRLTNDDFMELQINIRKLWNEWISPQGFFKNFDKHLARC